MFFTLLTENLTDYLKLFQSWCKSDLCSWWMQYILFPGKSEILQQSQQAGTQICCSAQLTVVLSQKKYIRNEKFRNKRQLYKWYNYIKIWFHSKLAFKKAHIYLTCKSHYKHTYWHYPWNSTVGFIKLAHQIVEEYAKAFNDSICKDLNNKKGHSHNPSPATIWYLRIDFRSQATSWSADPQYHDHCQPCRKNYLA